MRTSLHIQKGHREKKELIKEDIERRKKELPKLKEELRIWESML